MSQLSLSCPLSQLYRSLSSLTLLSNRLNLSNDSISLLSFITVHDEERPVAAARAQFGSMIHSFDFACRKFVSGGGLLLVDSTGGMSSPLFFSLQFSQNAMLLALSN